MNKIEQALNYFKKAVFILFFGFIAYSIFLGLSSRYPVFILNSSLAKIDKAEVSSVAKRIDWQRLQKYTYDNLVETLSQPEAKFLVEKEEPEILAYRLAQRYLNENGLIELINFKQKYGKSIAAKRFLIRTEEISFTKFESVFVNTFFGPSSPDIVLTMELRGLFWKITALKPHLSFIKMAVDYMDNPESVSIRRRF